MSRHTYDSIATVYSTDMGQSMAFDDVGYYRELCRNRGGSALEVGCGTGRILLPLLRSGIDIRGVDQSPGMLEELKRQAAELGLTPRVQLGSMENFTLDEPVDTVLAPYSVITYVTTPETLDAFLNNVKRALKPGGLLALDTFIPRDVASFDDYRLDYRRPHEDGTLQREKRIQRVGDCNRIERRYTLFDNADNLIRSWDTTDVIRPYSEQEIIATLKQKGFEPVFREVDFKQATQSTPQFICLGFSL